MIGEVLERFPTRDLAWPRSIPDAGGGNPALRDLFRGSLLWGAVGDAMGRPDEGRTASAIIERHGPDGPSDYIPWHGWQPGRPKGSITDDTQLTMVVAESLLASGGTFDGDDYADRLITWLDHGRGKGRATTDAVLKLKRGIPWTESASPEAAGNGAAMRAAPIGLMHALDATPEAMIENAILFSVPTHAHPVGVGGAAVMAAGVAYLVRRRLGGGTHLDTTEFIGWLADVADAVAPVSVRERRRPSGAMVTLADRLREAADTDTAAATLFDRFWSGAFVIESLPCAINAFLRSPDDPLRALRTSLRAGHDVDTIASMAGNLAGAWMGADALRAEAGPWWAEIEYRDRLIELADGLLRSCDGRAVTTTVEADL